MVYTPSLHDDAEEMMLPEEHDSRIYELRAATGVELRDVHSLMDDKCGANNVDQLFDDVLFVQCPFVCVTSHGIQCPSHPDMVSPFSGCRV